MAKDKGSVQTVSAREQIRQLREQIAQLSTNLKGDLLTQLKEAAETLKDYKESSGISWSEIYQDPELSEAANSLDLRPKFEQSSKGKGGRPKATPGAPKDPKRKVNTNSIRFAFEDGTATLTWPQLLERINKNYSKTLDELKADTKELVDAGAIVEGKGGSLTYVKGKI